MALRNTALAKLNGGSFDVLIIGGGINGAVSAAVLAGRGATVVLVDRGDFGSFTSQESSNLVWGGFKYLEGYEILLVRKLCVSRNRLIKSYPDNIKPIPFLATLDESSPHPARRSVSASATWLRLRTTYSFPRSQLPPFITTPLRDLNSGRSCGRDTLTCCVTTKNPSDRRWRSRNMNRW